MRTLHTHGTHGTDVPVVAPEAGAYSPQVNTPGHRHARVLARLVLAACACLTLQILFATTATADPTATDWHRLRDCESTDNYDADTGNGYYGAYQFDARTWHSVGGTGLPHQNTPAEQDYRALYLYRMRGWSPWGGCTARLGLREDSDARSQRIPTRADAAYIAENPYPKGERTKLPNRATAGGDVSRTPARHRAPTTPAAARPVDR